MSVIKNISLKNRFGLDKNYDIGADVENITYSDGTSLIDTIVKYSDGQLQVWDDENKKWINRIQLDDKVFYVDGTNGDDENAGTESSPFKTISKAIKTIGTAGDSSAAAQIYITDGTYTENLNISGKNISISGISGDSADIVIKGTFTASESSKVYIDKINFSVNSTIDVFTVQNEAYVVILGSINIAGNNSTAFCSKGNSTIHINQCILKNLKYGFKVDGGTIRVFNDPVFTNVNTGAIVLNGGEIHLKSNFYEMDGLVNPYDLNGAVGGRVFAGSLDQMIGATSAKDGVGGMVPRPFKEDRNKYLKGDGTWSDISGGLVLKGTCTFANLPSVVNAKIGDSWVISNAFTTTTDFKVGSGKSFPAGTTVYLMYEKLWNVLGVGIIPIQQGGTGLTSSPSMLINLASTSADTVLKASPRPGVTGILSASNGGTGLTTSPSMRVNLASTSADTIFKASPKPGVTGILKIINGGTGNNDGYIRTGQKSGSVIGFEATAEGSETIASGDYSHAEGNGTTASNSNSHAEGANTTASGNSSHAEGKQTTASGNYSHAEGLNATASGDYSHAEGNGTTTTASGNSSHAEGSGTTASGNTSHAEGLSATASGNYSHAEGGFTSASGYYSHAEGNGTTASGDYSHAGGANTTANQRCVTAIGEYNKENYQDGSYLIIGCGNLTTRDNIFRIHKSRGAYLHYGNYNAGGADYAELFEWKDGNKNKEDRRGLFVTLDGDKIVKAKENDFILGIVSAVPAVLGNSSDENWVYKFKHDIFGKPIYQKVLVPDEKDAEGKVIIPAHEEDQLVLNPDFDDSKEYIPRSDRPEWDAVGMLGKLVMVDDGTCEVNGYCKPGNAGRATKSNETTRFRVMKRLDNTHILVLILS